MLQLIHVRLFFYITFIYLLQISEICHTSQLLIHRGQKIISQEDNTRFILDPFMKKVALKIS